MICGTVLILLILYVFGVCVFYVLLRHREDKQEEDTLFSDSEDR